MRRGRLMGVLWAVALAAFLAAAAAQGGGGTPQENTNALRPGLTVEGQWRQWLTHNLTTTYPSSFPFAVPKADDDFATDVTLKIVVYSLMEFHELSGKVEMNLWLYARWTDTNLKWDPSEWGGVDKIIMPPSSIWTPDLVSYNGAESPLTGLRGDAEVLSEQLYVIVTSDGQCHWSRPGVVAFSCSAEGQNRNGGRPFRGPGCNLYDEDTKTYVADNDGEGASTCDQRWPARISLRRFPFDKQLCELKIGAWSRDGDLVNVEPEASTSGGPDGIEIFEGEDGSSPLTSNNQFELKIAGASRVSEVYSTFPDASWPAVHFYFEVSRYSLDYIVNLIVPVSCAVLFAFLTFAISPDAVGERVGISMTAVLTVFAIMFISAAELPKTDELTTLSAFYLISIVFTLIPGLCATLVGYVLDYEAFRRERHERRLRTPALLAELMLETGVLRQEEADTDAGQEEQRMRNFIQLTKAMTLQISHQHVEDKMETHVSMHPGKAKHNARPAAVHPKTDDLGASGSSGEGDVHQRRLQSASTMEQVVKVIRRPMGLKPLLWTFLDYGRLSELLDRTARFFCLIGFPLALVTLFTHGSFFTFGDNNSGEASTLAVGLTVIVVETIVLALVATAVFIHSAARVRQQLLNRVAYNENVLEGVRNLNRDVSSRLLKRIERIYGVLDEDPDCRYFKDGALWITDLEKLMRGSALPATVSAQILERAKLFADEEYRVRKKKGANWAPRCLRNNAVRSELGHMDARLDFMSFLLSVLPVAGAAGGVVGPEKQQTSFAPRQRRDPLRPERSRFNRHFKGSSSDEE
ncbi:unnamed protein product [Pedinophyceae sp. YPF-701]|nr:unnamed protein product [Pedinophyceae sp. YPF-701]